jgi:phosphatidate cytidylyltransferase
MAKARKDVKFNHRGSGSGSRPRRLSNTISEHSETASEKGSPQRNGALGKVEVYIQYPDATGIFPILET